MLEKSFFYEGLFWWWYSSPLKGVGDFSYSERSPSLRCNSSAKRWGDYQQNKLQSKKNWSVL